jgi:hypothetical protein
MTVRYLQAVQKQQTNATVANNPEALTRFHTGFSECVTEVSRYINLEDVEPSFKRRLLSHLNSYVNHLQQMVPFYSQRVPYMPERFYPAIKVSLQNDLQSGDENNNGSARMQIPNEMQLIPGRLPSGELALVVQSAGTSANFPLFPPAAESSAMVGQSSDLTAVHRPLTPSSPSDSVSSDDSEHLEHPRATSPDLHQSHSSWTKPAESGIAEPRAASSKSTLSLPAIQMSSSDNSRMQAARVLESEMGDVNQNPAAQEQPMESNLRKLLSTVILRKKSTSVWQASASSLEINKPDLTKRRSDEMLKNSDKKPRCDESASSSSSYMDVDVLEHERANDQPVDNSQKDNAVPRNPNERSKLSSPSPVQRPFNANTDMWRPW